MQVHSNSVLAPLSENTRLSISGSELPSTGQSTENFRDVLADLQKLQGKAMNPAFSKSVDTYA